MHRVNVVSAAQSLNCLSEEKAACLKEYAAHNRKGSTRLPGAVLDDVDESATPFLYANNASSRIIKDASGRTTRTRAASARSRNKRQVHTGV
jgi:hypothetical protein